MRELDERMAAWRQRMEAALRGDVETVAELEAHLRTRDPAWGLRDIDAVKAAAGEAGLSFAERRSMPANNLMLLFRRT